jgi:hypothetical protein
MKPTRVFRNHRILLKMTCFEQSKLEELRHLEKASYALMTVYNALSQHFRFRLSGTCMSPDILDCFKNQSK